MKYYIFKESEKNRKLIDLIQSASFLICLDEAENESSRDCVENMLHGGSKNAANRWYDSTLQFIITDNGDFGICYEHSVCEG